MYNLQSRNTQNRSDVIHTSKSKSCFRGQRRGRFRSFEDEPGTLTLYELGVFIIFSQIGGGETSDMYMYVVV